MGSLKDFGGMLDRMEEIADAGKDNDPLWFEKLDDINTIIENARGGGLWSKKVDSSGDYMYLARLSPDGSEMSGTIERAFELRTLTSMGANDSPKLAGTIAVRIINSPRFYSYIRQVIHYWQGVKCLDLIKSPALPERSSSMG